MPAEDTVDPAPTDLAAAARRAGLDDAVASPADRAAAARRIVGEHPQWSDRGIAAVTGLNARTVASIRTGVCPDDPRAVRLGRDGRVRPLSCEEGRRLAGEFLRTHPGASLRSVARASGISVGTAHDVRDRLERGEEPVLGPRRLPSPVVDEAPAPPGPASPVRATAELVSTLADDPSIRYATAGRALLRMITLHVANAPKWTVFADSVPPHCARAVAHAARGCARMWLDLADQLDRAAPPEAT